MGKIPRGVGDITTRNSTGQPKPNRPHGTYISSTTNSPPHTPTPRLATFVHDSRGLKKHHHSRAEELSPHQKKAVHPTSLTGCATPPAGGDRPPDHHVLPHGRPQEQHESRLLKRPPEFTQLSPPPTHPTKTKKTPTRAPFRISQQPAAAPRLPPPPHYSAEARPSRYHGRHPTNRPAARRYRPPPDHGTSPPPNPTPPLTGPTPPPPRPSARPPPPPSARRAVRAHNAQPPSAGAAPPRTGPSRHQTPRRARGLIKPPRPRSAVAALPPPPTLGRPPRARYPPGGALPPATPPPAKVTSRPPPRGLRPRRVPPTRHAQTGYFSTVRLLVTPKTPETPLAAMPAMFLSPSVETGPSSVTLPFFTMMWIGGTAPIW